MEGRVCERAKGQAGATRYDFSTNFEQSDILGKEQWAWLKDQLTVTDVDNIDLILVGSGIQVLPIVGMASEKHETYVN